MSEERSRVSKISSDVESGTPVLENDADLRRDDGEVQEGVGEGNRSARKRPLDLEGFFRDRPPGRRFR